MVSIPVHIFPWDSLTNRRNWDLGVSLEQKPHSDDAMHDEATVEGGLKKGSAHVELMKSNNFDFQDVQWQDKCPFASHIRKTRPRGDRLDENGDLDDTHAIVRRGVPYGPKTQRTETLSGISMHDRGLLFVSYQSNLRNGFRYMQKGKFTGYYSSYQNGSDL